MIGTMILFHAATQGNQYVIMFLDTFQLLLTIVLVYLVFNRAELRGKRRDKKEPFKHDGR